MKMFARMAGWGEVILLASALGSWAAVQEVRNVVVIGWDGAQRDHMKEMMERNELPTLAALAKEGRLVDMDVTDGATDTKAGWTQNLTGYKPDRTGVYSNGRYQPIPEGYSVFERLERHFGASNIDTVAIVGKKGHVDNDPPSRIPYAQWQKRQDRQKKIDQAKPGLGDLKDGRIVEVNGAKFVETHGKPWYIASQHMDLWTNGLVENEKVASLAMSELEERKDRRFFFFVHFAEPDHAGHKHGENSQAYTDAMKSDDEWTGKIVAKLKELGVYDQTLIYVIVDHGFNEGAHGHKYAPYVFLSTNDPKVSRDGNRMDVAPTILKRFGLELAKIEPRLDGIPLDEPAPDRKASPEPPADAKKGRQAATKAGPARKAK